MKRRILVVSGADADRNHAQQALGGAGYETDSVANGQEAFEQLMAFPYDLVVTDACLDKLTCQAMLAKARGLGVKTPILLWSQATDPAVLEAISKVTAVDYVDKAAPIEALLDHAKAILNGGSHAAPATPEPVVENASKPTGGVLLIDDRANDIQALRELLPQGLHFQACANVKEGLAHAHQHKFDLVLFSVDAMVTNLAGLVAQLHLLLPDAFVLAVANPAHNEDPQAAAKALRGLDFDEVLFKPFTAECANRFVGRYCSSWDDLVVVTDDLVEASPRCSRKENYKDFVATLKARLEQGVRSLIDACFDRAIVDVSRVDSLSPMDFGETLRRLKSTATPFGLSVRFVATQGMAATLRKFETSFGWERIEVFPSVAAARAAKA
jgi:DNA-binding NtrC family response regulator